MREAKPATWPPKVGQRIHLNSGHARTSWTGVVRAVVDDQVAIIRRYRRNKGWSDYYVEHRWWFEDPSGGRLRLGPLPREMWDLEEER